MRNAFIVPYFGKFPNYFPLTLKSMGKNAAHYDWLFFTDDKADYDWPQNAKVFYISFAEMQTLAQKAFDFPIKFERPYKLCDLKPAYGRIFEKYLCGYDFWGHCDIDVIFGQIDDFLKEDAFKCDKILRLGHMVLYRNTPENNCRFMLPVKGVERYKQVLQTEQNCIFDEDNSAGTLTICDIWKEYGFSEYRADEILADTHYKSTIFQLVFKQPDNNGYRIEKKHKSIFYWTANGQLVRLEKQKGTLAAIPYIYIHFMGRPMRVSVQNIKTCNQIKIIPNEFLDCDTIPQTAKQFDKEKWRNFNLQYIRVRSRNLIVKINRKLKHTHQVSDVI